jgi:hypothetical protein
MRNLLHRSIVILGVLLAATHIASAQAIVSAERGAEISAFGQATLVTPDWGQKNNLGYTLGVDYTRFIRSIVQPSIELRITRADGLDVAERSYAGGLKLAAGSFRGVEPYVTVLLGHGNIDMHHSTNSYVGDSGMIYSLGGGGELNVTSKIKLRLDMTRQTWHLDPNVLNPLTFSVGVSYRLGLHGLRVQ